MREIRWCAAWDFKSPVARAQLKAVCEVDLRTTTHCNCLAPMQPISSFKISTPLSHSCKEGVLVRYLTHVIRELGLPFNLRFSFSRLVSHYVDILNMGHWGAWGVQIHRGGDHNVPKSDWLTPDGLSITHEEHYLWKASLPNSSKVPGGECLSVTGGAHCSTKSDCEPVCTAAGTEVHPDGWCMLQYDVLSFHWWSATTHSERPLREWSRLRDATQRWKPLRYRQPNGMTTTADASVPVAVGIFWRVTTLPCGILSADRWALRDTESRVRAKRKIIRLSQNALFLIHSEPYALQVQQEQLCVLQCLLTRLHSQKPVLDVWCIVAMCMPCFLRVGLKESPYSRTNILVDCALEGKSQELPVRGIYWLLWYASFRLTEVNQSPGHTKHSRAVCVHILKL